MSTTGVPTTPNRISCVLLDFGWSWSNDLLMRFTEWLAGQNINEKLDMVQLELGDLRGVEQWPREASFTIE